MPWPDSRSQTTSAAFLRGGTRAHSVGAALDQYLESIDQGLIELAPSTILTSRSAIRTMKAIEMPDGRQFGNVRLSKLGWQEIEHLYAGMRASGRGNDWIRRCATVLARANRTLVNARDGAERFVARVEAVRPAIRGTTAKQAQLRETIRSARNKVGAVRDTAVRIDQEGLGVGAASLPVYKPTSQD